MRLYFTIIFLLAYATLSSQSDWRELVKRADKNLEQKQYFEAGANYRLAWEKKSNKTNLIFEAAKAYLNGRAYREAAEAYSHILDRTDFDPLIQVKYARCLKLDGQYTNAKQVFQDFIKTYEGGEMEAYRAFAEQEILGCDLGLQMRLDNMKSNLEISLPGSRLNTEGDEFSPFIVDPVTIYYTGGDQEKHHIYRSDNDENQWTEGGQTTIPEAIAKEAGSMAFSPDGNRLYFTRCQSYGTGSGYADENCMLFYTEHRQDDGHWSEPRALSENINLANSNNSYPHVLKKGGKEILLFCSDREGGEGGLDIWYAVRPLHTTPLDFEPARNLGPVINKEGNELTPYFDAEDATLYFSSNSHVSIGGLDIFSAKGNFEDWNTPVNVGVPLNSHAHDYFYTPYTDGRSGLLVSNRYFGIKRDDTRQFDLFKFSSQDHNYIIYGATRLASDRSIIKNGYAFLYELLPGGKRNHITDQRMIRGLYSFSLQPNKFYEIEIQIAQLPSQTFEISTISWDYSVGMEKDFFFDDHAETIAFYESSSINYDPNTKWLKPKDVELYRNLKDSNLPKNESGDIYRVQVGAYQKFNAEDNRFVALEQFGPLGWQRNDGEANFQRVYIGSFTSLVKARAAQHSIQEIPDFRDAFVVLFTDSQRIGKVNEEE